MTGNWREAFRFHPGQLRTAFFLVWAALSLGLAAVLLASAAPSTLAFRLAPQCESKLREGQSCSLCGMTHAFVSISRGNLTDAAGHNPASLPLYAGILANQVCFALTATRRLRRRTQYPLSGELSC
jgi:hypothetical protein